MINQEDYRCDDNGTDSVKLTVTTSEGQHSYTFDLNVRKFSSVNDATNFYNNVAFGYPSYSMNEDDTAYYQTTGQHTTALQSGVQLINLMTANIAVQQGEFVMWGVGTHY